MTEYLKVVNAAKRLGISRARMYKLMEKGKVPTVMIDGFKFVDMNNLGSYQPRKNEKLVNPRD